MDPEMTQKIADIGVGLDTVWVLVAAVLVFLMQAGFAMVESGFTRAKNAVNIMMKNLMDFCLASVLFFVCGYAFMFGTGTPFIGTSGFMMVEGTNNPTGLPLLAFWIFQVVFCGTAATIVSGAVAERIKFSAYLIYSAIISAVVYPIVGHWIWGGGWLAEMGFFDFAGSTVVHATGGWAGLMGAIFLGPRIGKFKSDGTPNVIPGHNIPIASLGVFLLWFGWFGFNAGSNLAVGDGAAISLISVNTSLAAATGAIGAMITVWIKFGKPDLSMSLNGALAGLVGITAPCAFVSPTAAMLIGVIAGVIVVFSVGLFDKLKIDDPVGAVSVHGICGVWGTLAVGIWGQKALGLPNDGLFNGGGVAQLGIQAIGSVACTIFTMVAMGLVFFIIKQTIGLRVEADEELRGLDIGEHGMESYSGFQIFANE
ncbi:MAG: ammonium transporter [Deltaproteobacteria bacterium]|nr:ammonium transporter [bacterium]MCB9476907.1 ammonium transporter [Deltaproteobacteria bacterium]MCB9489589.1 ammonium transporter [Deltaproteobacteria bacterium]